MSKYLLVILIALSIVLAACTKAGSVTTAATDPVKEFRISMTHGGGYSPKTFEVNKGDAVRFLATSDPVSHRHGMTIDGFNVNVEVTKSGTEQPQAIEFVADKAGTFTIYCKVCESGPLGPHPWMTGTLIVK